MSREEILAEENLMSDEELTSNGYFNNVNFCYRITEGRYNLVDLFIKKGFGLTPEIINNRIVYDIDGGLEHAVLTGVWDGTHQFNPLSQISMIKFLVERGAKISRCLFILDDVTRPASEYSDKNDILDISVVQYLLDNGVCDYAKQRGLKWSSRYNDARQDIKSLIITPLNI